MSTLRVGPLMIQVPGSGTMAILGQAADFIKGLTVRGGDLTLYAGNDLVLQNASETSSAKVKNDGGTNVDSLVLETNGLDRVTVADGGDVTIAQNATVSGQLTVTGAVDANGAVNAAGLLHAEGNLQVDGTSSMRGDVTMEGGDSLIFDNVAADAESSIRNSASAGSANLVFRTNGVDQGQFNNGGNLELLVGNYLALHNASGNAELGVRNTGATGVNEFAIQMGGVTQVSVEDDGDLEVNVGNQLKLANPSDNSAATLQNTGATGTDVLEIGTNGVTRITIKDAGDIVFAPAVINMANLPTSSTGLATGDLWNDAGTLKVA